MKTIIPKAAGPQGCACAVAISSEVLASRGRIYPSTHAGVSLEAELADGKVVSG